MAAAATPDDFNIPTAEPISEMADHGADSFESTAPSQNMGLAVLKRWPWLLVGVVGGLVLGLLYHTQQAPVYQSIAQLLVIKNRPEVISGPGGSGSSSLTFVEDYVTTQVTLLRSEMILLAASNKLRAQESNFQIKPPASDRDCYNFMLNRFTVMRERETGSNQPTNILALTFRSGNPSDSALYLRSIIAAYDKQLQTIYSEATTTLASRAEADANRLSSEINDLEQGKDGIFPLKAEITSITHEDLTSMRSRLTTNVNEKLQMQNKLETVLNDLKLIEAVGRDDRPARMDLLLQMGGNPRSQNVSTLDSRNPQDVLLGFNLQRMELSQKFGKDHPEMQAIDGRIRMLERLVASNRPDATLQLDELATFARLLAKQRDTLMAQIERTTIQINADEKKIERVGDLQGKLDSKQALLREKALKRELAIGEKQQLLGSRNSSGYKVENITQPTEGVQVSPVLFRSILFGLFLGLAVGGGLAVSMELTDRSFRSPAEIRRRLGLPILGHIPRLKIDEPAERESTTGIERSLVCFYRPTSTEAEAYRGVRTQLYFSTQGRGHQVIQVTSPNPGDGKSTLAANLAISIAQSGKRVILIDCDFRKPRVHKIFNAPKPDVGLASVMSGDADLMSAVQPCEVENLSLMPCGPRPANPAELLTSPKFSEVLRELREHFDFVIVDTPPVLAVSDPSAVAPRVDGVLLVFRMTKHARPLTERAREQLAAVGARMLGVVVNASSARSAGYGGYGYAYQYEYQYAESYSDQET